MPTADRTREPALVDAWRKGASQVFLIPLLLLGCAITPKTRSAAPVEEKYILPGAGTIEELLDGSERAPFVPGGVADRTGRRIYIESPHGEVIALDARSGETVWRSREGTRPLIALRGLVLAASRDGMLRLLDERSGRLVARLESLGQALPLLNPQVRREKNDLVLSWTALLRSPAVVGDAPPPREKPGPPAVSRETHAARIDLGKGTVRPTSFAPADAPVVALPFGASLFRSADAKRATWVARDRILALAEQNGRLQLFAWTLEGEPLQSRELVAVLPKPGYLQHLPSPDPEHVYLMQVNDHEVDGLPAGSISNWSAFSVREGSQVMNLRARDGFQPPFSIFGDRLLYLDCSELAGPYGPIRCALHAIDRATGKPAWSQPIDAVAH